jgi:DNA-binding response OmpR family regulator
MPRLDPSEAAILSTLKSRTGEVVPINDLMPARKWGDPTKRNRLFRVRLYNLREKMCEAGFKRHWIETVRGHGVRLVEW